MILGSTQVLDTFISGLVVAIAISLELFCLLTDGFRASWWQGLVNRDVHVIDVRKQGWSWDRHSPQGCSVSDLFPLARLYLMPCLEPPQKHCPLGPALNV